MEPTSLARRAEHLKRFRAEVANWAFTAPLSWLATRRQLSGSAVGRLYVVLRMRDGSVIRCRLADSKGVLSVRVSRDYHVPGIDWSALEVVVDIGAHVGSFTTWIARRSPKAHIIALEPSPVIYPDLVRNVALNSLSHRVTVRQAALGGLHGHASFEVARSSDASRLADTWVEGAPIVEVMTLSTLFQEHDLDRIDLLKLDCEGAEYEILLGARAADLTRVGYLLCEFHQIAGRRAPDIARRLASLGFDVQTASGARGMLIARRPIGSIETRRSAVDARH